jgi:hypothetical protein
VESKHKHQVQQENPGMFISDITQRANEQVHSKKDCPCKKRLSAVFFPKQSIRYDQESRRPYWSDFFVLSFLKPPLSPNGKGH